MQTTHTPGPWAIVETASAHIGERAILDADGYTVCNPSPMGAANARLIAAAPAMLEALTLLLNVEGAAKYGARLKGFAGLDVSYHFDAARAAIAAATGEQ